MKKHDILKAREPVPSYLALYKNKTLHRRAATLKKILASCTLCPRACKVNRIQGQKGFCGMGKTLRVAYHYPHYGEEPGSGVIFLSGCTARCLYCQNHRFSQEGAGKEISSARLAAMMLELQNARCHNINLVSPTHFIPQILESLLIAAAQGLRIPLVYNSSGYESVEILKMLEGVIDIYLVDAKYRDDCAAEALSSMPHYHEINFACIKEMIRQAGNLRCDAHGVAWRGVIVRHLILPGNLSQSKALLGALARTFTRHLAVSLMSQYIPDARAYAHPLLRKKTHVNAYRATAKAMLEYGFYHGWVQED